MVKAVLSSIPDDWRALVAMDYSDGFWERMLGNLGDVMFSKGCLTPRLANIRQPSILRPG